MNLDTGTPASITGQQDDPDRFTNLPHLLVEDGKELVTAPIRWEASSWTKAGVGAAAILGTALLLDKAVDKAVLRHDQGHWDGMAESVRSLGSTTGVAITGGIYLAGIAFQTPELRAAGVDAVMASVLAQVVLTIPMKELMGRSRPNSNQGTHDFHPLGGGKSFPSGHTTQAFAMASVISEYADQSWVSCVTYGLAGFVGISRVEQRHHFLSDVVAGALIGTCTGRAVVAHNQKLRERHHADSALLITPMLSPGGLQVGLRLRL